MNTAAQHDDAVAVRFNEVLVLLRRPESLISPAFVVRVLRGARRGPAGAASPVSRSVRFSPGG